MIGVPGLSASVLDRIGRIIRAVDLHIAVAIDVDLDPGRAEFFRRGAWPVCRPGARRDAASALKAHLAIRGLEGLHDTADVCGPAIAMSCAAQIAAGELGPNEPDTDRTKARRGQPPTRGVATGALVQALRTARPYEP